MAQSADVQEYAVGKGWVWLKRQKVELGRKTAAARLWAHLPACLPSLTLKSRALRGFCTETGSQMPLLIVWSPGRLEGTKGSLKFPGDLLWGPPTLHGGAITNLRKRGNCIYHEPVPFWGGSRGGSSCLWACSAPLAWTANQTVDYTSSERFVAGFGKSHQFPTMEIFACLPHACLLPACLQSRHKALKQEDHPFQVNLGNRVRPCLNKHRSSQRNEEDQRHDDREWIWAKYNDIYLGADAMIINTYCFAHKLKKKKKINKKSAVINFFLGWRNSLYEFTFLL
jgi:hypothetical protein